MQIVSSGDNLHEMSKTCFLGRNKIEHISKCRLLKILPRMLSVKERQWINIINVSSLVLIKAIKKSRMKTLFRSMLCNTTKEALGKTTFHHKRISNCEISIPMCAIELLIVNSEGPDQTAHAHWSGSSLFTQSILEPHYPSEWKCWCPSLTVRETLWKTIWLNNIHHCFIWLWVIICKCSF